MVSSVMICSGLVGERGRHVPSPALKCPFRQAFKFKDHLSHKINSRLADFMGQVIALDKSNAMLPSRSAFHLNRSLHHVMHKIIRNVVLFVVVQNDCVEVAIADVADNGAGKAALTDIGFGCVDDIW